MTFTQTHSAAKPTSALSGVPQAQKALAENQTLKRLGAQRH
jgi:hypothetical protein